ncbi:F-box and leucine-rich repeat protein 13-like [Antedon mediterranea]|uniref:F-box and leucine-rich repeat protein 13-like n=1 Tax=Antedon mediterranea TaxID=105859 RepID=UPI003AF7567A
MASLKVVDPELRRYLKIHKIPDIFESVITSLAVQTPDDPYEFIICKLKELIVMKKETVHGLEALKWDYLIPDSHKPTKQLISGVFIDSILVIDDENLQPAPEMYQRAYHAYNSKLITMTYRAWFKYHMRKRQKRINLERKMRAAAEYYHKRKIRIHMEKWVNWYRFRMNRHSSAYQVIETVYNMSLGRMVFEAWHNVMLDARRTREYFERIERGELDGEDYSFYLRGGARVDISLLPRKVAVKIFSYLNLSDLSQCSLVCRSWNMIIGTCSLWSRVDLSAVKNRVTDRSVGLLLQKCRPYLLHLNLRGCNRLQKSSILSISQCRNLQDLNLSECQGLNDGIMREITEGCHILLYLNISYTNITDATLRSLARWSCNMQYLSLAYCKRFSDKGLQYLATGRGCRKLIYLDLSGCRQITSEGYKNIANGCSNIQSLSVNDNSTVKDDSIVALASRCHNLRNVSFLATPNITDVSIKVIAQHKKLQKIRIEGNTKITDASLKYIGRWCSDLRHVYMVDCPRLTDASLKSIATCRNINIVNFADCIRISDNGVRVLVEGPSGPKIREMNFTNCVRVSDISIMKIMQKCYSLVYGVFCFCEHVTDAGGEMLGNLFSLTSVDLSGCSLADTGLAALGNNVQLRDVTLAECFQITDLGIQKFAQQCRELDRLDVSHCTQLTNNAIKNLAFCCRHLRVLNLAGCIQLNDLSLQYLSGVCHYLMDLDISGCFTITDRALKFLRKGCKRLKILTMLYCRGVSKTMYQKLSSKIQYVSWSDDPIPVNFGPGFDYLETLNFEQKSPDREPKPNKTKAVEDQGDGVFTLDMRETPISRAPSSRLELETDVSLALPLMVPHTTATSLQATHA